MINIEWIEPKRIGNTTRSDTEVRIAVTSKKAKQQRTTVTFYWDSYKKITHGERMMAGISVNRLYFQEAYTGGYKIGHPKRSKTACIYIPALLNDFIGEYKLQYDGLRELYFIEKEEK